MIITIDVIVDGVLMINFKLEEIVDTIIYLTLLMDCLFRCKLFVKKLGYFSIF